MQERDMQFHTFVDSFFVGWKSCVCVCVCMFMHVNVCFYEYAYVWMCVLINVLGGGCAYVCLIVYIIIYMYVMCKLLFVPVCAI